MSYILHYAPDNASLIVRMALEHIGQPYTTQLVDRAAGAQGSASYLRLNPHGLIPVLETPQGPIFETGAILLWLADTHGGLGPGPAHPDRAAFLKWLFFTANTLHPSMRMLFYPNKYIGDDVAQQDALRSVQRTLLRKHFAQLDQMADVHWIDGSALAFYLGGCLRWCAIYPANTDRSWFTLADTPRLAALCAKLDTLPCTAATIAAEGLGPTPFTNPIHANPPEGSAT
ncbi:glutathione S-transferase [Sulfitobacter sp. SK012]|uniref:glutathione S-transferase family protein n=1 Tax=Sulfitobacter sp. SK012 TaxID=1389005 RepID=UPI000E0C760A|nr:glutathione S-transferase family protein [Sulfitobacter sp. SK012]AXI47398.1 glutathione S-transferase [Sulfitobacter sp. SK012]